MMKYATLTVRFSVIKESDSMDLKRELTDYEIGGIGDIKKTHPPVPFIQNWNREWETGGLCGI